MNNPYICQFCMRIHDGDQGLCLEAYLDALAREHGKGEG